ncbi:hypothetical protein MAR_029313 [Mya arenaria]|uniref:Uncharacterized protein n=1 Tax=Mya arenaria TaxID=6604 RepID=A0ABY7DI77_MYAAR|nr:hypothetical protein MAR_029313 [Mya arenaria]
MTRNTTTPMHLTFRHRKLKLTEFRREEMMSYKVEAVKRETRIRSRRHEELQAKVQSIVAGVEERRAAKQASRSSSKNSSPASHSSRKSSRQKETPEKAPKTSPKLVVSSVNKAFEMVINNPATKAEPIKSSSRSSSTKSSPISATKSSPSPSKSSSIGSGDAKKRDNSMYRSLGKVGTLTKQKSYSSQHLDRVGASLDVNASSQSTGKTSSLSPKPSSLFPHPPVGRPPSRGGSMRQSSSTPDLRTIDMSVQAEDLRKPWPRRSMSPKGGRPQAPVKDESTPKLQRKNAKTDDSKLSSKSVVNSDGKKNGDKKTEPIIDKRKADIERKSNAEKSLVTLLQRRVKILW